MKILFRKIGYWTYLKEKISSFFITNNLARLSKQNELKDYFNLLSVKKNEKLHKLHYEINIIRNDIKRDSNDYDYGQGYFYQSVPVVNITGYRNTEERVKKINLSKRLYGKKVLDIGSNVGAILFQVRHNINHGVGIERSPYLIKKSNLIKTYLNATNIDFINTSFEEFLYPKKFDVILSLANHNTIDGNTQFTIKEYFEKIYFLLSENGTVIFESHPASIEKKADLDKVISTIDIFFNIVEKLNIQFDGFLDKNRTHLILEKKN